MSNDIHPTLDELDVDGAIRETAARVDPVTRMAFMRRAGAIIGGGIAASTIIGGALPSLASAKSASGDIAILNYALTLEYLEAAFYKEAVSKGALSGELKQFATVVAGHEAAHVTALKQALGSRAVKSPSFDFKGTTGSASTFARTAKVLEDTGVEAYQGQATNIQARAVLRAAISIHPVEAHHAAWVAAIMSKGGTSPAAPAPAAFNPALDMKPVLAAVQGTGFISTMSTMSSGSSVSSNPAMTG